MNRAAVFATLILTVLSFTACERKDLSVESIPEGVDFEISAGFGQTKTVNDGIYTRWAEGDSVHVYHKKTGTSTYVDDGAFVIKDVAAGTFKGRLASALAEGATYDWKMIYPYTKSGSVSCGAAWQVQDGNGSMAHLRGAACPLQGELTANPAEVKPKFQMHNLATVARVVMTNKNPYPMTVNTVKVKSNTLQVINAEPVAKDGTAEFYVPMEPFTQTSGSYSVSVDGYERKFTTPSAFEAGRLMQIDFDYDCQDKSVTDVTVWESNRYSSFTDIVFFDKKYYCAFREAGSHVVSDFNERGKIIIRSSDDCRSWKTELEIVNDFDNRDPHFIISNDGDKLMVYYGMMRPIGEDGYFPNPCSAMCVLDTDADGKLKLESMNNVEMKYNKSGRVIDKSQFWLWGITKHAGKYYGVAYYIFNPDQKDRPLSGRPILVSSTDGIHYEEISDFLFEGKVYFNGVGYEDIGNEASPCFIGDRLYVFFRSVQAQNAIVTYADPPYTRWGGHWKTYEGMQMHCPIAIPLWDKIYVCMRGNSHGVPIYAFDPETKEFKYIHDVYANTSTDRAYPGMIVQDDALHVVYYAYKQVAQNIYYQRIPLNKLYDLTLDAFGK